MDGLRTKSNADSFWKKNLKNVPGRPSPKKEAPKTKAHATSTSYQDFQDSVNDAWAVEEDDEFLEHSDVRISRKVAQSAALSVINSHRSEAREAAKEPAISQERKADSLQRLAIQKGDNPLGIEPIVSPTTRHFPGHPQLLVSKKGLQISMAEGEATDSDSGKVEKFHMLLEDNLLNLDGLRQLSWSGIPIKVRAITWRLLAGYLPASLERRENALERKRLDYWSLVSQYYDTERDEIYADTYRQIHIDIPRMSPLIPLFQQKTVQEMFERILFIWAIRHPASGYVQGINDLVTPFFMVFLQEVTAPGTNLENCDVVSLPEEQRKILEADSFWCLSKFLDGIQDNYIFAQLGIQQKVNQLKELIQRYDVDLHNHLIHHGVDYLQFSFRWMNNLLTRELPLHCTIRLWDTYLAESDGFAMFQLYVCAAFLLHWRRELLEQRDFQSLLLLLQNLPTSNWSNSEVSVIVAEAYKLKYMFAGAPNHLQNSLKAPS
ncbi:TBC1 domain family member 22B [Neocloeon triangulifer]|uniref:TBC1 domain family member 22B n=1 Tax=Neocloeon triangulifer TaxID=2078957 RepID=UPI00286EF764|nr:TBC1 domain family member 22B [Neocloeon triangulifer]